MTQVINYKAKDTLKEVFSVKEYWGNGYKWKLEKKKEVLYSYYKMY